MPLDSHSHLVSQGWSGKGTGLRNGAISKPIIIAQKKTLSGLGKDRDEAFPFWDHVYNAAVGSIQIKLSNSDSEDEDEAEDNRPTATLALSLTRTSTGIISNRRPTGSSSSCTTPGNVTPLENSAGSNSKVNLMTLAKREAAKKGLYSRFFRGPILGPEAGMVPANKGADEGSVEERKDEGVEERAKKRRRVDDVDVIEDEGGVFEEKRETRKSKGKVGKKEKNNKDRTEDERLPVESDPSLIKEKNGKKKKRKSKTTLSALAEEVAITIPQGQDKHDGTEEQEGPEDVDESEDTKTRQKAERKAERERRREARRKRRLKDEVVLEVALDVPKKSKRKGRDVDER